MTVGTRTKLGTGALSLVLAALALTGGGQPAQADTDEATTRGRSTGAVLAWNANAGKAAVAACIAPSDDPLHESRMYAMVHVAIHDALNAIDRRFRPYAVSFRAPHGTSVEVAVATAARDVMVPVLQALPAPFPPSCIDAGVASVEADYAAALAQVPDGPAEDRGVQVGRRAAEAVLALRAGDGSDTLLIDTAYPQGTEPGEWRFTPGTDFAFAPGWGGVTPFVLRDASQFRADPPYDVTSRRYARDVAEVQRLGGDDVTTPSERTADQTEIALFWLESSPLAWNRLARTVVADRHLDDWEQARLFGLLNMALADGYVGSFETKFTYAFWRPVTAIQLADTDGNRRTTADPTWTPLVTTPPIPDHDSAHAVEGAAAAGVLRRVLGTDRVSFSACSLTLPAGSTCNDPTPVLRQFTRFSQAAAENGVSRIYVGFHFRNAVDDGLVHGDRIADRAVDRFMRPVG